MLELGLDLESCYTKLNNYWKYSDCGRIKKCLSEIPGVQIVEVVPVDNFSISVKIRGGDEKEIIKVLTLNKPIAIFYRGEIDKVVKLSEYSSGVIQVSFTRI